MTISSRLRGRRITPFVDVVLVLLIAIGTVLIPVATGDRYLAYLLLIGNIYVVVGLSQSFVMGEGGQAAFGIGAIFGSAAYVEAIAINSLGLSLGVAMILGVVGGTVVSLLVAIPSLRIQGFYLGVLTLGSALVLPDLLKQWPSITGAETGLYVAPGFFGDWLFGSVTVGDGMVIALVTLTMAAYLALRYSWVGRSLIVAATSSEAAGSLGIRGGPLRFIAFGVAGIMASCAGVLYLPIAGTVNPGSFDATLSVFFLAAVVVGGLTRPLGAVVGTWAMYLVSSVLFVSLGKYQPLFYGTSLLVISVLAPAGIVGSAAYVVRRIVRRQAPSQDRPLIEALGAAIKSVRLDHDELQEASGGLPSISISGARLSFGGVVVLDNVSMSAHPGTITSIVGPNGSGKTSLLNSIGGFVRLDSGTVTVRGQARRSLAPHRAAAAGVGRTFQVPFVFSRLDLWENLQIGNDQRRRSRRPTVDTGDLHRSLTEHPASVADLNHATRRFIEIVRVITSGADILLFDEPAAGLSRDERRLLGEMLTHLRDQTGACIVLVEHDLDFVQWISDQLVVLEGGRVAAAGSPEEIMRDPETRRIFVGRS